jgi:hypothetical protein
MPASGRCLPSLAHFLRTFQHVLVDLCRLLVLMVRSHRSIAAESLFLRRQLALFQERKLKPHRADDSTK